MRKATSNSMHYQNKRLGPFKIYAKSLLVGALLLGFAANLFEFSIIEMSMYTSITFMLCIIAAIAIKAVNKNRSQNQSQNAPKKHLTGEALD